MRFLSLMSVVVLCVCVVGEVKAQTINVTQALDFGEAILTDNFAQREIIVASDGTFSHDPEYVVVTNPEEGIYQLTGDLPNRPIASVTIIVNQELIGPGGFQFTIDNFDIDHPTQTNNFGEATIRVGARIRSSGVGGFYAYPDGGTFNGDLTLSVNY